MAVSNNIFTMKEVNAETTADLFSQLATLLGVGTRADGRIHLADLCQSASVNKWAKYKPFRFSADNFASVSARDMARKSAQQGFDLTNAKIGSNGSLAGIADKYDGEDNGWNYIQPRGREYNEPNRLRDFDGYNHSALPFIGGFSAPSRWSKTQDAFNVSFRIVQTDTETCDLTHLDIPAIAEAYIGVALVDADGNVSRMTADDTIANVGVAMTVPVASLTVGDYIMYPFFSTKKLSFTDEDTIVSQQYTVPNTQPIAFSLAESSITIYIEAQWLESLGDVHTLDYSISITNNTAGAITLSNNWARLRYSSKSWNDALVVNEKENELADITVGAGETNIIHGFFTQVVEDLYNDCRFWVSLQTGSFQDSKIPDQIIKPDEPEIS